MLTQKFFVIAQSVHEGTLWLLVVLSVFSIAFIIERYFTLSTVTKKSESMAKQIQETLHSNNLKDLEDLSRDRDSIEGRALSYGLRHTKEHGTKGLEEIFDSYGQLERQKLERRLGFLATVGSNAPFIGLLGTVFGIMDAFHGLASSSGQIQAVLIGISNALVATAAGLIVAIPAVIAYNYFQRRVKMVLQNLESTKDICVAYAKAFKG